MCGKVSSALKGDVFLSSSLVFQSIDQFFCSIIETKIIRYTEMYYTESVFIFGVKKISGNITIICYFPEDAIVLKVIMKSFLGQKSQCPAISFHQSIHGFEVWQA